jgi:PAS domain S-box-containing protein
MCGILDSEFTSETWQQGGRMSDEAPSDGNIPDMLATAADTQTAGATDVETVSGPSAKTRLSHSSMLVKLALFVSALLILTTGLMSWAGYVVARNIIREQIHERLRVAAVDRHQMVLSFVAQQLERAGLVASRTKLRNLIAQFEHGELSETDMQAGTRPIIEDALRSTDGFLAISIADPEGRVLTSTSDERLGADVSSDPAFQVGLTGRHLGEPSFVGGEFVTSVAAPAKTNDGELLGVVLVELDVTPLFEILTNTEGLGDTGEVLVGKRDGKQVRYLFGSRHGAERMAPMDSVPAMAAAIGGATQSEVTDYSDVEVLVHYRPIAYQPLEYQPWGLVAKIDVAEAYAPLDDFRESRFWVQLGLVAVGLVGSFWVSRRMTRPIRELTRTATAVAAGDLAVQVAVTSDDEIGTLGRTFNMMTRQLQSSYSTLEDRVRQRTAELSSEIARREDIQSELQQNAERIKRIIDTANDAFISMDADGLIVEWNPQAKAMFGWSRDEALKLPVADMIVPESFRGEHRAGLDRFLKTREAKVLNRRLELTALRRDGSEFPVEVTITPQRLGDKFVFNAFLHDITQRKQDEEALHDARVAAELANTSKSEFLANMSHEIRTPMNGIIGMGELLASTNLEPDQRDYLNMVRQSADSLLGLLNDILDFSKIEAGKLELESIPFSLRDCIGNTGHTLSSRAAEKGIELACRIAPEIPDILVGDPGRLRQLIVNLAGNAIKFTEVGEVVVEVVPVSMQSAGLDMGEDGVRSAGGHTLLQVSVRDTGIGIPPEKQEVIFEAFGQADASTTRQYGGTGLGLAISTQLVKLMHGQIQVESEVGKGTTFTFTAEFGISPEQKLRPPSHLAALRGMSVLVVDDNATNRRILYEILASWNMQPLMAESGDDGLRLIQQARANGEPIPLVLLDCMMPGMDGFDFAEHLRESVSGDECKVIMVSSAIQAGDSERCHRLDIARCMPKPVMHSELLNTILSEIHPESTFATATDETHFAGVVFPRRILLAEDGTINQQVATGFLEQRGHHVLVVGDGQLAVEAVAREAFDLVLMDVQMPNMDGFAATAAIRLSEAGTDRHLPIIAMTANAMKGDRERCLAVGMDDYVAKPVEPESLFKAVESVPATVLDRTAASTVSRTSTDSLAGESALVTQGVRSDDPLPENTAESSVEIASEGPVGNFTQVRMAKSKERLIDWDVAMQRLPGGDDVARDLAGMFMLEAPGYVEQMRTAIDENNAEVLR